MTIKEFLNKYFEEHVEYNDERCVFVENDFWKAWDYITNGMDRGVQWFFEWYYDQPALSKEREKLVIQAIDNYIKNVLKPIYLQ